jgi:hypothetical protein
MCVPTRLGIKQRSLREHRAQVDPRPGLGVQEIGRRSPSWALRPALPDEERTLQTKITRTIIGRAPAAAHARYGV